MLVRARSPVFVWADLSAVWGSVGLRRAERLVDEVVSEGQRSMLVGSRVSPPMMMAGSSTVADGG